jgi:hypothetical protein
MAQDLFRSLLIARNLIIFKVAERSRQGIGEESPYPHHVPSDRPPATMECQTPCELNAQSDYGAYSILVSLRYVGNPVVPGCQELWVLSLIVDLRHQRLSPILRPSDQR